MIESAPSCIPVAVRLSSLSSHPPPVIRPRAPCPPLSRPPTSAAPSESIRLAVRLVNHTLIDTAFLLSPTRPISALQNTSCQLERNTRQIIRLLGTALFTGPPRCFPRFRRGNFSLGAALEREGPRHVSTKHSTVSSASCHRTGGPPVGSMPLAQVASSHVTAPASPCA